MSIRTLADAEAFLAQHTNLEVRSDWSYDRLELHLERFVALLADVARAPDAHLRQPPTIHVAGTKGKGSTCLMLDAAYRAAGFTTGRYTSPHLSSITERIAVNGEPISDRLFAARIEQLRPAVVRAREQGRPVTYFEILTAAALVHFADPATAGTGVDVVLLEVGLGGRLDATNVVDADVAVIPQIGYDHTARLGATLPAIAGEKAGILKSGRPAIIGPDATRQDRALTAVFRDRAASLDPPAPLLLVDTAPVGFGRDPATGTFHLAADPIPEHAIPRLRITAPAPARPTAMDANLACALLATLALAGAHPRLALDPDAAANTMATCHLPARAEIVLLADAHGTRVILDGAHQLESLAAVAAWVAAERWRPHLVLGLNQDKLSADVLRPLVGLAGTVTLTTVPSPRAATPSAIHALWRTVPNADTAPVRLIDDPLAAYAAAVDAARADGEPVLVTGSFYLAGAIRPLALAAAAVPPAMPAPPRS